ncbi:metallophosphoesterase [Patescibacteria group bacterium]|nr:metallophosphoesterase [Patescibacteria group bacterium]
MRTLILPDIHTKHGKAQQIIEKHPDVDEVVCLGDYFDNFGDSGQSNMETAIWLKNFLKKENHVALLGNHEFNYAFNRMIYGCSGYTKEKRELINDVLTIEDWKKLKPYYMAQGWYLTHAGISRRLLLHMFPPLQNSSFTRDDFGKIIEKHLKLFLLTGSSLLFEAGRSRNGKNDTGGITWCHFPDEFGPIKGIKQIFGHTRQKEPTWYKNTENLCLDTGLNHYAIIEDGKVSTITYKE